MSIYFDKGEETIGIFMDLSQAFNCVEHTLLMLKLQNLGINGASLECFKSNFSDRKQYVVIKQISETGNIFSRIYT